MSLSFCKHSQNLPTYKVYGSNYGRGQQRGRQRDWGFSSLQHGHCFREEVEEFPFEDEKEVILPIQLLPVDLAVRERLC